jgi:16S rRNA (guanine966-N2)-methyltransferase
MGRIRIIGGKYRSRIITFNDNNEAIRPTPDRVRETLFNWLGQDLTNKRCLDLFAGSGALSFEALSRNAKQVVAIEHNNKVYSDLLSNKQMLKIENLLLQQLEAIYFLNQCQEKFDVIFLDPPFASNLLQQCLEIITNNNLLTLNGIIYIESQKLIDFPKYEIIKKAKAGMVNYALLKLKVE